MDAYKRATVISAVTRMPETDDMGLWNAIYIMNRWKQEIREELAARKVIHEVHRERAGPSAE